MMVQRTFLGFLLLAPIVLGKCAGKACTSSVQCGSNNCCLSPVMRRGRKKRQEEGTCSPRGGLGDSCYVRSYTTEPLVYYDDCPCQAGLECQGSDNFVVPQGRLGTCVVPPRECRTSDWCLSDECCVSKFAVKGRKKRQTGDTLPGICKKQGGDGDSCLVNNSPGMELYQDSCPCASDLMCKGLGYQSIPLGEVGVCEAPTKECNSGKDCNSDECCVSNISPIGRKKRQTGSYVGTCKKLSGSGDSCLVNNSPGQTTYFESCPCSSALKCVGSGLFVIPLGETGTCTA